MRALAILVVVAAGAAGAAAPGPKVLAPEEATALAVLAGGSYRVDPAQAFSVTLGELGRVQLGFACSVEETPRCKLVVAKDGKLVFRLDDPLALENGTWACEPAAVSFADVDGDRKADLAVIFTCMTGIGPTGAHEFPVGEVLLFHGGTFAADARITKAVEAKAPKSVKALVAVARAAVAGK